MKITDIKIRKTFEEGPLRAVVSLTFDDQLALHDVKVIYARDRYFVVMPSRKNPDGTFRDMVHPINAAFREEIETAIIAAYRDHLAAQEAAAADVEAYSGVGMGGHFAPYAVRRAIRDKDRTAVRYRPYRTAFLCGSHNGKHAFRHKTCRKCRKDTENPGNTHVFDVSFYHAAKHDPTEWKRSFPFRRGETFPLYRAFFGSR